MTERPLIIVEHDHEVHADRLLAMQAAGVTTKMVQIGVDARLWASQDEYLGSIGTAELAAERERICGGCDTGAASAAAEDEDAPIPPGYLRSALVVIEHLWTVVARHPDRLAIALSPDDIEAAHRDGRGALVISTEGTRLLEGRVEVLHALYRLGLRQLGLSWATRSPVGDPQSVGEAGRLRDFGRAVVDECNALGIVIDVDHLALGAVREVAARTASPIVASHCGAAALNPLQPTAYPDDVLRAIAATGGVLACHFMSQVVKPGRDQAPLEALLRQIEYIAELVGPAHVALGPDFAPFDPRLWENQGITEPFTWVTGMASIEAVPALSDILIDRGFTPAETEGIMGRNLLRLLGEVHAARSSEPREVAEWTGVYGVLTGGTSPL